jgi:hypothetical protein
MPKGSEEESVRDNDEFKRIKEERSSSRIGALITSKTGVIV